MAADARHNDDERAFPPVRFSGAEPLEALRHSLAGPFVEPEVTLVLPRCSQLRRQVSRTQGAPPEPGVVRGVPRDVAEGCQGHSAVPACAGQLLSGSEEGRPDAASCMVRVNADLLDVKIPVEHFQPDEADGRIPLVHGDQEPTVFQCGAVGIGLRRWRVGYPVHADSSKQLVP
jgi:hypothetical protein